MINNAEFENTRKKYRWLSVLLGIAMIALGIWAFFNPGGTVFAFVWVFATGCLFKGIVDMVLWYDIGKTGKKRPGLLLLNGILDVILAILLFSGGAGNLMFAAYLFAFWFLFDSISSVMLASAAPNRGVEIFIGILGIMLSIGLLFNPILSVATLAYMIAIYLIIDGIALLFRGF